MDLERHTPESPDLHARGQLHAEHVARYEFAARYTAGKNIVDVASGAGYGSAILKRHGAASVVGLDLSAAAVAHASAHYGAEGVTFQRGDVSQLKNMAPVDCVVSFETIEHLNDPLPLLAAARDVLGASGLFIVSTPVRQCGSLADHPENPHHVREWNEAEFDELLRRYFPLRQFHYQYICRRRFYPLSRTLHRWALHLIYPRQALHFSRFAVLDSPPDLPSALVSRGFMVVVCSMGAPCVVRDVPPQPQSVFHGHG